jgi:hypothetical protein
MGRSFESIRMGAKEVSARWLKFRSEVEALLQKCGKQPRTDYRLKHQLIEAR